MRDVQAQRPAVIFSVHDNRLSDEENLERRTSVALVLRAKSIGHVVLGSADKVQNGSRRTKDAIILDYTHLDDALELAKEYGQDYVALLDAYRVVTYRYLDDRKDTEAGRLETVPRSQIKDDEPYLYSPVTGQYYVIR